MAVHRSKVTLSKWETKTNETGFKHSFFQTSMWKMVFSTINFNYTNNSSFRRSGRVTDVKEGHEYEFRVIAVNKVGPSIPSDISKSVVAKPRFSTFFVCVKWVEYRTVWVLLTKYWLYDSVAPKIDRKNLAKKEIRRGKFLKFEADVEGEPAPTITWSFNGQAILFNDR